MSIEDDIPEGSPLYEVLVHKGETKGLEEGSLRELRSMVVRFTTLRFPDLVSQAQKQAKQVKSQEPLRAMIDKLVTATTDQEARTALIS